MGSAAHQCDLTVPFDVDVQFDAAFVIGGLHHCVSDLPATMANLSRMIRPGGRLFIWEPNADFLLQRARDAWYRRDDYFEYDTERALTLDEIAAASDGQFELKRADFFGGPAYFLILNSLVTRIPLRLKSTVAPALFALEAVWNRAPSKRLFPTFAAVWLKKP